MAYSTDGERPASATDKLRLGRELTATLASLKRAQKRREAASLFDRILRNKQQQRAAR